MLMRAKVPKAGSVLLSGVVIGLIEFLIGAGWAVAVGFIAGAVIAELLARIGHYKSFWLNTIGYSVYMMFFALGTYLPTVRRLATGTAAPSSTRKSGRQHRRSFGSLSVSTAAPIPTMIGDTVRSTTAWIPAATPPLSCGTMRSRRRCSRQTRSPALPHTPSYGPM